MLPGILMQLAKANPMMTQIKQMMGMVKAAQDPTAMLHQMAQGNPQVKQVLDIVNQYGGDTNKAFYAIAEQRGIDPQEILNMLK